MWTPLILTLFFAHVCVQANPVNVTVYYESLCPDSIRFIVNQLHPTLEKLGADLAIDYIPYGNAKTSVVNGVFNITCQHGPGECYGNEIQSCAIALNENTDAVSEFIFCAMSGKADDDDTLRKCAETSKISWDVIQDCIHSGLGVRLHAVNGDITNSLDPRINYAPSVFLNRQHNATIQDSAEFDLLPTVCALLDPKPEACNE